MSSRLWVSFGLILMTGSAVAATFSPPMLDINGQCGAKTKRNVTAMSECIVAESEARADILQRWNKLSDLVAEKCVKDSRKAKRVTYVAIAKCIDIASPAPAAAAPEPPEVRAVTH